MKIGKIRTEGRKTRKMIEKSFDGCDLGAILEDQIQISLLFGVPKMILKKSTKKVRENSNSQNCG